MVVIYKCSDAIRYDRGKPNLFNATLHMEQDAISIEIKKASPKLINLPVLNSLPH